MVTDALGRLGTVLLLGGTSEIGLAIISAMADRGLSTVVLAGRRPAALEDAAVPLRSAGLRVATHAFDADRVDQHEALIDDVVASHGDLDVTIVAFGVLGDQMQGEKDPHAAVAVARTNFIGGISVLTVLGRRLREQGHGKIIVLSSVAGEHVRRSNYIYGASKAGLDGFALALGEALIGTGASVLVVRPGFVRTRMTTGLAVPPLSTTPAQVADAVLKGVRRNASVIWVPASLRGVISVLRHLPRSVVRRIPV